jgi:hypothetical protein
MIRHRQLRSLGVGLFSFAFLILFAPLDANATPITYTVNRTVGAGSVTGTIQTDGTLGVLATGNITDWNLHLSDGLNTFDLTGPLSGNDSVVLIAGIDVTATATQLLFSFDANISALLFQQWLFSGNHYYCDNSTYSACIADEESVVPTSIFDPAAIHIPQQGLQVIGTVSNGNPAPEPATLALLGLGLAGLGFSRRKQ